MKRIEINNHVKNRSYSADLKDGEYQDWIDDCLRKKTWGASDDDFNLTITDVTAEYEEKNRKEEERLSRSAQVQAFRSHLVSGGDLTKEQLRKFMIAVIDRLM